MKLCVKRIYCPSCQKLTKCQENEESGKLQIVCYRCGNQVFSWDGFKWRYVQATTG